MKAPLLPEALATNGTEKLLVVQAEAGVPKMKRMAAALFADAGNRPTQAELIAAVLAVLAPGETVELVDQGDGTLRPEIVDNVTLPGLPTAATPAANDNSSRIATTEFVQAGLNALDAAFDLALATKSPTLVEGAGINLVVNPDGTITVESTVSTGLADGTYGDVVVSGGGTIFSVRPTEEAYGAGWNADPGAPTKNALFAKIEAMVASIGGKVASTLLGTANGVATLDATGKVPAAQLPAFVDDVLEFNNFAALPNPGETGKIYVTTDTTPNKSWRWSGSGYVEIAGSPGSTDAVTEGAVNKYFTEPRVLATVVAGLADVAGTPSAVDSLLTVLGKIKRRLFSELNNVDNTSDANKPVSTATQNALNAKAAELTPVNAFTAAVTISDATNGGQYNKFTGGTARTITYNATPSTGHSHLLVNRGTVNLTIACAGGYYKNGGALATANLTLVPNGRLHAFHEGAGVWTFDGTGF